MVGRPYRIAFSLALAVATSVKLKAAGLPVSSAERDERHPLVIAGGPCITANPMPLAPFFDVLCLGEAEPLMRRAQSELDGAPRAQSTILPSLFSLALAPRF